MRLFIDITVTSMSARALWAVVESETTQRSTTLPKQSQAAATHDDCYPTKCRLSALPLSINKPLNASINRYSYTHRNVAPSTIPRHTPPILCDAHLVQDR